MKNTILTILILTCSLYSCVSDSSKEELLPDLVRAEALMYSHPDSALTILETMPEPPASNRLQNATWSLLLVQARDKNYVKHTSDSLINVASDYFMKQDDPGRKALVLNYEGRVNEDLGEVEKATRLYLQAKDVAVQTDDYKLRFLIESNLGTIYLYRSLYKEALDAYTESCALAQKVNDPGYLSSAYSYLGRVYIVTERSNEAILSYKKAIQEAEKTNEIYALSRAFGELAAVYEVIGKYDSAFVYLKKDETLIGKCGLKGIAQTYLGLGSLYSRLEAYDSALIYLNKSLLFAPNLYTKKSVYEELSQIAEVQGDYRDVLDNMKLFQAIQDTIQQQSKRKEIAELHARYNHEKLKNENAQLKLGKERAIKAVLYILIFFITIASYILYVYQRKLLQKEHVLLEKKEQLEHNTVQLHKNQEEIKNNDARIRLLTKDLATSSELEKELKLEIKQLSDQNECLEKRNEELQKSMTTSILRKQNELMEAYQILKLENEKLSDREQYLCEKLAGKIAILNLLREDLKCINTDELWNEIEEATNLLYNNFAERLKNSIPGISKNDIRFCSLIKLDFSNTEIAILTMVEPPAVTKHKQRLKKSLSKALNQDFSQRNSFEEWLQKL